MWVFAEGKFFRLKAPEEGNRPTLKQQDKNSETVLKLKDGAFMPQRKPKPKPFSATFENGAMRAEWW